MEIIRKACSVFELNGKNFALRIFDFFFLNIYFIFVLLCVILFNFIFSLRFCGERGEVKMPYQSANLLNYGSFS